jgi:hypothetical protein
VSDFARLPDLASARLGGRAVVANDEFFAPKENLVLDAAPVFDPARYTDRGKWMDGWETRRRREPATTGASSAWQYRASSAAWSSTPRTSAGTIPGALS